MISNYLKKECSSRDDYLNHLVFLNTIKTHAIAPSLMSFELSPLLTLHKKLFSHIKGAGTMRKDNKELASASCIDFKLLPTSLRSFFSHLNKVSFSPFFQRKSSKKSFSNKSVGIVYSKNDFAKILASLYREFLILSPFITGNTITAKVFFEFFANSHRFNIEYYKVRAKEFSEAEIAAIAADDAKPLFNVFNECLGHKTEGCISHQYSLPQGIE